MIIDALTRLHYGAPYLDAVIRSTEGLARRHWIIYAAEHNFPGNPTMPCPDTRDQLYEIARIAGGDRLMWVDNPHPSVDVGMEMAPKVDAWLELDSDEVIHQDLAMDIEKRLEAGELTAKRYRIPMLHHWRSFKYVCTDGQWPVRLYLPMAERDETIWYEKTEPDRRIHHFGYCTPRAHQLYKWELSIHKNELRPDWLTEIYDKFPERLTDLHPVSLSFWNAEPIDLGELPACLITHPYRFLEMVD